MENTTLKKVTFITHVPFWKRSSGGAVRDLELLRYLSTHFALSIIYFGKWSASDLEQVRESGVVAEIIDLGEPAAPVGQSERLGRLAFLPSDKKAADTFILRGIESTQLLDALPASASVYLDSHDLVSERTRKLEGAKMHLPEMSREEEIGNLRRFDKVICIQEEEATLARSWIGQDKVILAPHPVPVTTSVPSANRRQLGIIASSWPPNVYGVYEFVKQVWPTVRRMGAELHVYGTVCNHLHASVPNVTFHGFKENIEDCYEHIGLIVNPVTQGAGLKIKTVEAMARGLPVVSTVEGASGLHFLDDKALLVSRNWQEFADNIHRLLEDENKCREIATEAQRYVEENLSVEKCFGDLKSALQSSS